MSNTIAAARLTLSRHSPAKVNKHCEDAGAQVNAWVSSFNLLRHKAAYENFYASRFFELSARFFPDAPREKFKLVTDFCCWVFIWDDQCDMMDLGKNPKLLGSHQARLLEVLAGDEPNSSDLPVAWALNDIRQRLLPNVPIEWFRTFMRHIEDYFSACAWEASNRANRRVPGVELYIEKRLDAGAYYPIAKLIEYTQNNYLPEYVLDNSVVKELTRSANNLICWHNDICSLDREMKQGDVHNLVVAIRHERQMTLEQATEEAIRMYNTEERRFMDLAKDLPRFGEEVDAKLKSHVLGLRYCVGGSLDWHISTYRYQAISTGFLQAIDEGSDAATPEKREDTSASA